MSKTASLEIAIRRQLRRLVNGEASVKDFAQWLAPRMRRVEGSRSLKELAYEIQLRLSEFSNRDWSEQELKAHLKPLITTYRVAISPPNACSVSFASATSTVSPGGKS